MAFLYVALRRVLELVALCFRSTELTVAAVRQSMAFTHPERPQSRQGPYPHLTTDDARESAYSCVFSGRAEGKGFEPSKDLTALSDFRDRTGALVVGTPDTVAKSGYDRSPTWLHTTPRNRYSMRFLEEAEGERFELSRDGTAPNGFRDRKHSAQPSGLRAGARHNARQSCSYASS